MRWCTNELGSFLPAERGCAVIARYFIKKIFCTAKRLGPDDEGSVAVVFALLLPVLIGFLALAVEVPMWHQSGRSLQNAADEAAIAAATNGTSTYDKEANSVTRQYGYTNGVANITVTANNNWPCPDGTTSCYKVAVSRKLSLILSQVVGFTGNTFIGQGHAVLIPSAAVAEYQVLHQFCVLTLSTNSSGFQVKGGPKADLSGCSVMSNYDMGCNGHNTNADYAGAVNSNTGCGNVQESGIAPLPDPYTNLSSSIPINPCSTYPQLPGKKGPALPATNLLSGAQSWASPKFICGDAQLSGDLTLSGTNNVLVIENGQLDTNNFTIKTASGSSATIIFSGDIVGSYTHAPTGGGTIDIAAPTSGAWSGVALYQDPKITTGVDISAAGNSPTWNITGLIYLPHATVTFKGAVGKSSNGSACVAIVADKIDVSGTGYTLAHGGCAAAGLTMPHVGRGRLVA